MKKKILSEYKKGNIVFSGIEGLQVMNLSEFIKQPVEGILYDLNRNEAVVLTFLPDPKWVNDYAAAQVIRALKSRIDELEEIDSESVELYDSAFTLRDDDVFDGVIPTMNKISNREVDELIERYKKLNPNDKRANHELRVFAVNTILDCRAEKDKPKNNE